MDKTLRQQQLARLAAARQHAESQLASQQRQLESRFDALEKQILHPDSKPNATRQRIITAALELLDEQGLNDLSLRKLAAKVQLKAPALYWYFKNKEALIDYMAEAILQQEFSQFEPRQATEKWQDWLVHMCSRLRTAMLAHRDGGRIVAGAHLYPAVTLAQLMEVASDSLVSAGLAEKDVDIIVGTAIHFTFGRVIEEQSSPTLEEIQSMDASDIASTYPRLARNIERIQTSGLVHGFSDDSFERSIRLIVR